MSQSEHKHGETSVGQTDGRMDRQISIMMAWNTKILTDGWTIYSWVKNMIEQVDGKAYIHTEAKIDYIRWEKKPDRQTY